MSTAAVGTGHLQKNDDITQVWPKKKSEQKPNV